MRKASGSAFYIHTYLGLVHGLGRYVGLGRQVGLGLEVGLGLAVGCTVGLGLGLVVGGGVGLVIGGGVGLNQMRMRKQVPIVALNVQNSRTEPNENSKQIPIVA